MPNIFLQDVEILRYDNDNDGLGKFAWGYDTSDGTKVEQTGDLKSGTLEDGTTGQFQTMKGSYSSVAADGKYF